MKNLSLVLLVFCLIFSNFAYTETTQSYYGGKVKLVIFNGSGEYPHIRIYTEKGFNKYSGVEGDELCLYLVYKFPKETWELDSEGVCYISAFRYGSTNWHMFFVNGSKESGYEVIECSQKTKFLNILSSKAVTSSQDMAFYICPASKNNLDELSITQFFTVVIAPKGASKKTLYKQLALEGRPICNTEE